MRSVFSVALFAASTFAAVIRDTGHGHGYTNGIVNGNLSPPNCPTPVTQYKSNSERMYAIYKAYCDSFLYPANLIQVQAINSTLFSANIQGRVDITNTFDGPELNTEYIYGLFAGIAQDPSAVSLLAVPVSYEIRQFIAAGDFLHASLVIQFHNTITNDTSPMLVHSTLMIDGCDKIQQYDSIFDRADWYFDYSIAQFVPVIAEKLHLPQALVTNTILQATLKTELAISVCSVAQKYCTGENQIYDNEADCLLFMATLDIGKAYQFGQNTIGCRNLHQSMVPLRPSVHCPHLSKTGGGMCVDREYVNVTEYEYFNFPMMITQ